MFTVRVLICNIDSLSSQIGEIDEIMSFYK